MAESSREVGGRVRGRSNLIWRHWCKITRFVGIVTCAVLWGISISIVHISDKRIPAYLIISSLTVTFFELTFLINKVICCSEDTCGHVVWLLIMAMDNWKKTIFYTGLSIVCFLEPTTETRNLLVAGIFMNLMAVFYLVKTFKDKEPPEPYLYKQLDIG